MKWHMTAFLAALTLLPCAGLAQKVEVVNIGHFTQIEDRSPTTWAMSGMEIIHLTRSDGTWTPIMRSMQMDARTVEILSRAQTPPLSDRDFRTVNQNGHQYIVVRRYMLAEVLPQDAHAAGLSVNLLAQRWVRAVQRVLPQVAPAPGRFGI